MDDYREMYYALFHQITETIAQLQAAQQEAEEIFLAQASGKSKLLALPNPANGD